MTETGKYPITTICGSMRFYPEMLCLAENLTANGHIVLMPFLTKKTKHGEMTEVGQRMLDDMQRDMIAMSQQVYVVTDESDYWGRSTEGEITFAKDKGIPVMHARVHAMIARYVGGL
jgi:hypothetical protein